MAKRIQHKEPTITTQKQILAACGNQCAFPGCSEIIVERDHGVLIGKIAHIKARREGGPRFDYAQLEEENRSASNLIALCGKHHDIVDARKDIYTAGELTEMKSQHEEKVENSADRSWIRFPKGSYQHIKGFGSVQFYFWIDRTGRPQIYTDRKLAIARTAFDIYMDINKLCQLYQIVEDNPESPGKSLLQSNVRLNKSSANLDADTKWSAIAHLLVQMAEIPDVTFGEFVSYLVEGGDATDLFVSRASVLTNKIQMTKSKTTYKI